MVRPRLADAAFFWEQDRKQPLWLARPALDAVTFQAKLGSLGDKMRRVRALAGEIAAAGIGDRAEAERAAELCKCDLLTAMVGEFPELQGIMGTYYALADGEPAEVAVAIREHYLPRGAGDELPETTPEWPSASPTSSTRWPAFSRSARSPPAPRTPSGCAAPPSVCSGFSSRSGSTSICANSSTGHCTACARTWIAFVAANAAVTPGRPQTVARRPAPAGAAKDVTAEQVYDFIMERLRAYYLEAWAPRRQRARRL